MLFCRCLRIVSAKQLPCVLYYAHKFVDGGGSEHGYAGLSEVWDALEHWTGCQVAAGVEYAPVFVDALHVDAQLLLKHVDLFV